MIGPRLRLALRIVAWLVEISGLYDLVLVIISIDGADYPASMLMQRMPQRLFDAVRLAAFAGILFALLSIDERIEARR